MTVKNSKGKTLFSNEKIYGVYDLHLPENKEGWLGLSNWDITAMTHIDLGLEPGKTDSRVFVVPLKKGVKSVDVEVVYSYIYEVGVDKKTTIHTVSEKVEF